MFLQSNITRPVKQLTAKHLLFLLSHRVLRLKLLQGKHAVSPPLGQPMSSSELSL